MSHWNIHLKTNPLRYECSKCGQNVVDREDDTGITICEDGAKFRREHYCQMEDNMPKKPWNGVYDEGARVDRGDGQTKSRGEKNIRLW